MDPANLFSRVNIALLSIWPCLFLGAWGVRVTNIYYLSSATCTLGTLSPG